MNKFKVVLTGVVFVLTASVALAGPHFGKHGMHNPLERMIDHIDLTNEQERKVEDILNSIENKHGKRKGMQLIKQMIELNPDSDEYMQKVELQADIAAGKFKEHVLSIAKARQQIYNLLDDEQKEELEKVINKKLKRMAKHMQKQ